MVFSSPTFLFLFLPVCLLLYFVGRGWVKNLVLLVASLFFYAWGEKEIVLVMLASILVNYGFGLWLERARERGGAKRVIAASVVFNLGLLVVFKYANWIWENVSAVLLASDMAPESVPRLEPIHLPIGISFFTFQAMSYVIDVYRREGEVQRNPMHFAVYISLFPQLVAGPIVRYRDVAEQIVKRHVDLEGFAEGVRRFIIGLSKKLLVANVVAYPADQIFDGVPAGQLAPGVAWLGIVCYTLQIYFDFSGYSDMAIGLGRMFGFKFLENFDFPYIARSITEFWRRWHISLSSWFRDYLYIPLGGNRRGSGRTLFNLVTVFFLCGLWHGAAWNFVAWGLYHGLFLVFERMGFGRVVDRLPRLVRHVYVLLVVMIGWVFFRATSLEQALTYVGTLFGVGVGAGPHYFPGLYLDNVLKLALVAGVIGSAPLVPALIRWKDGLAAKGDNGEKGGGLGVAALEGLGVLVLLGLFLLSAMELSASTYNPFIYFRF